MLRIATYATLAIATSTKSNMLSLPRRVGPAPVITGPLPQQQADHRGPANLAHEIVARASKLPGVLVDFTYIGEGSRTEPGAFQLDPRVHKDTSRCLIKNEWGHMHVGVDNSGHIVLSEQGQEEVISKGWGVPHPLAGKSYGPLNVPRGNTLVFSPRDTDELETVWRIMLSGYEYVTGTSVTSRPEGQGTAAHGEAQGQGHAGPAAGNSNSAEL